MREGNRGASVGLAQARYSKDAILPFRALCAYVVHRNVTCVLQEGAESYIKAEYRPCGWGPKCPGTVT